MSTLHDIPELDAPGLRKFALMTGGIVAVLFGLLLPWLLGLGHPLWPWLVLAVLAGWGLAAPGTLRPVYIGWMKFGLIMNRIVTPIVLGVIFYALITPVALFMKVIGRDSMARGFDERAASYRVSSKKAPREKMEKPF